MVSASSVIESIGRGQNDCFQKMSYINDCFNFGSRSRRKSSEKTDVAWTNRPIGEEFCNLYKNLMDDGTKYFEYLRMTKNLFNLLLNKLEVYLLPQI